MEPINRKKKKPERYGIVEANLSGQSSEPFDDDSFDDKSYSPHTDEKNQSISSQSGSDHETSSIENSSVQYVNFDRQFEKIDQNSKFEPEATSIAQEHTTFKHLPNELNENSFQTEILNYLKMIHTDFTEIKIRIGVIEGSLIKDGRIISIKKEAEAKNELALYENYTKSKKMPFKTVDEFKEFDNSLKSNSITEAVSDFLFDTPLN